MDRHRSRSSSPAEGVRSTSATSRRWRSASSSAPARRREKGKKSCSGPPHAGRARTAGRSPSGSREAGGDQQVAPAGVVAADPSMTAPHLVDKTIATVTKNLLEGAVLVIVVLLLLPRQRPRRAHHGMRHSAVDALHRHRHGRRPRSARNLMSLGALDFGLIVDGAVIIVENCIRAWHMQQAQGDGCYARGAAAHGVRRRPARSSRRLVSCAGRHLSWTLPISRPHRR